MESPSDHCLLARFVGLLAAALGAASCGGPTGAEAIERQVAALNPGEAGVDFTRNLQSITGFGASSAFSAPNLSDSLADQLFSATTGVGLSLLRIHINPTGDTAEVQTATKAVARGARVWGSPWTPPGAWKDNGSDTNGGSLLAARYQDWANRLAMFAKNMANSGVPLLMLSAQNEPNWTADWETCRWTNTQLVTFIRANLGPALMAQGVTTKILGPETIDWNTISAYGNAILQDTTARGFVGAIATHGYGGTAFAYATPAQNGKEFWVTELDDGTTTPIDPGMTSGLRVAKLMHDHLTVAQVNAWHYWWLNPRTDQGPSNAALTDGTNLTRRAYVMGNWSKFVRPGFMRVEATAAPQTNVAVTAFRNPGAARIVIVAVNQRTTDIAQTFVLTGGSPPQVVPWVTSGSLALSQRPTVNVAAGTFSFTLGASSVTTFVGDLPGGTGTGGAGGGGGGGTTGAGGRAGTGGGGVGGGRAATGGAGGNTGRGGTGGSGVGAGGASSTGGAVGTGGANGTGGAIGSGGNVAGDAGVTDGSNGTGTGGAATGAGGNVPGPSGASGGGCGCGIGAGGARDQSGVMSFLVAGFGIALFRRRRAAAREQQEMRYVSAFSSWLIIRP